MDDLVLHEPAKNHNSLKNYLGYALAINIALAILFLFTKLPDHDWMTFGEKTEENPLIITMLPEPTPVTPVPPIPANNNNQKPPSTMQQNQPEPLLPVAAIKPRVGSGIGTSMALQENMPQAIHEVPPESAQDQADETVETMNEDDTHEQNTQEPHESSAHTTIQPAQSHTEHANNSQRNTTSLLHDHTEETTPLDQFTPVLQFTPAKRSRAKKQLSLADIAQSFLAGTLAPEKHRGSHATNFWRNGDDSIQPSAEEWIFLNYLNKFTQHLSLTLRCNQQFHDFRANFDGVVLVAFEVWLDPQGFLLECCMEPSGAPALDQIIKETLQSASPYPRLPVQFKQAHPPLRMKFNVGGIASILKQENLRNNFKQLDKYHRSFYN